MAWDPGTAPSNSLPTETKESLLYNACYLILLGFGYGSQMAFPKLPKDPAAAPAMLIEDAALRRPAAGAAGLLSFRILWRSKAWAEIRQKQTMDVKSTTTFQLIELFGVNSHPTCYWGTGVEKLTVGATSSTESVSDIASGQQIVEAQSALQPNLCKIKHWTWIHHQLCTKTQNPMRTWIFPMIGAGWLNTWHFTHVTHAGAPNQHGFQMVSMVCVLSFLQKVQWWKIKHQCPHFTRKT